MRHVGVRELRQNLSIYLDQVMAGERFVITERRQPVAVLSPLGDGDQKREQGGHLPALSHRLFCVSAAG